MSRIDDILFGGLTGGSSAGVAEPVRSTGLEADVDEIVGRYANQYGIDSNLAKALMIQESGGKYAEGPATRTGARARGWMQIMPDTDKSIAAQLGETYSPRDSKDPEINIRRGVYYLAENYKKFGREDLAVAAYHAGPGAVEKAGGQVPGTYDEAAGIKTSDYTKSILGRKKYIERNDFLLGKTSAPPAYSGVDDILFGNLTDLPDVKQAEAPKDDSVWSMVMGQPAVKEEVPKSGKMPELEPAISADRKPTAGEYAERAGKTFMGSFAELGKFASDIAAGVPEGSALFYNAIGLVPGKVGEWGDRMAQSAHGQALALKEPAEKAVSYWSEYTPEEQKAFDKGGVTAALVVGGAQLAALIPQLIATGGEKQAVSIIEGFAKKYGKDALVRIEPLLTKASERLAGSVVGMGEVGAAHGEATGGAAGMAKGGAEGAAMGAIFPAASTVAGGAVKNAAPIIQNIVKRVAQGAAGGGLTAAEGGSGADIFAATGLGLGMPVGKSQRPAPKATEKPLVAGEPVGPSFAQVDAEAKIGNAYTDKITARQDELIAALSRSNRDSRRLAVEEGMFESPKELTPQEKIKELYGDVRPTKSQAKKDLGISRENAGRLINEVYGKAEQGSVEAAVETPVKMSVEPTPRIPQPERATNPAAVEESAQPLYERRSNVVKRKAIDEMTPEEALVALKYDELTGLKSKRAWEDEMSEDKVQKPVHAIFDVDGLAYANDHLGYPAGDELLKTVSSALKDSGIDPFRVGGDEIRTHANDAKSIDAAAKKAYNILKDKEIVATLPDGSVVKWKGLGFSYGYGTAESLSLAGIKKAQDVSEERLHAHKAERTAQGLRAERKTEPPGISRIPPAGIKDQGNVAPFKKPDTAEDFPEMKQANETGSVLVPFGDEAKPDKANGVAVARQDTRNQVKNMLVDLFKSGGHMPESAVKEYEKAQGWLREQGSKLEYAVHDFNRAKKQAFKGKKVTSNDEFGIDNILRGEKTPESFPEELHKPLQAMRDHIDALSNEFIRRGIIGEELALKFKKDMGIYLNRSYQVTTDKKWYKKVPRETVNRATVYLKQGMPDATEGEIQGALEELLFKHSADKPGSAFEALGKIGAKNLSVLMKKGDIPVEIRALWGENRRADVNYVNSVTKMASLVANHQFLTSVKDLGLKEGWLREKSFADEKASYTEQIASKDSKTLDPLNGLYTTREIKSAFENQFNDAKVSQWLKVYMKVVTTSRYSKTVLSPITHVRNVSGNVLIAMANGHFNVAHMGTALKDVYADFMKSSAPEQRLRLNYLKKIGLIGESVNIGELRAMIKDATGGDIDAFIGSGSSAKIRAIFKGTEKLYAAEDDLWKIFAFENEKARYSKALPELKGEELDRYVTEIIRNTYPTYSKIPKIGRVLRRFPFAGTFVSFPAEIIRTGIGIARQTKSELWSSNKVIKAIGAQRAAGSMLAMATPILVGEGIRQIASRIWPPGGEVGPVSQKEENDMRAFVSPWAKNSELMPIAKTKDGKIFYVDAGYTDPYAYLKKPLIAMFKGGDFNANLFDAIGEIYAPFFGEDIVTSKIFDLKRNTTKSGAKIYNENGKPEQIAGDVIDHFWTAIEPGVVTQTRRVIKAYAGELDKRGQPYSGTAELLSTATVSTLDIPKSLEFKARSYRKGIAGTAMYQRSKNKTDFDPQVKLNDNLARCVTAARNLGLTDDEITSSLRTGGISKIAIETFLGGKSNALISHVMAPGFEPSEKDAERIWEEAGSPGSWPTFYRQYQKATMRVKDEIDEDILDEFLETTNGGIE